MCKGSTGGMHRKCLEKWVAESNSEICEICHEPYTKQEQCGCNAPRCFSYGCTLKPQSLIERALIACTAPHIFFGGVMMFLTPIDNYIFISSIKSLALILSLVMIQIYHSDTPFFVYRVALVWQFVYLILFCVVGSIKSDTVSDYCNDQCYKMFREYCIDGSCPVAVYYKNKTKKVDQACLLELVTFTTILIIKILMDCCTNMKVVRYHNRNANFNDSTSTEEEESLLAESSGSSTSSSTNKGPASSDFGDIEV